MDFSINGVIRASLVVEDLFDGRLEQFGITEHCEAGKTTDTNRCLTDGCALLWVSRTGKAGLGLSGINLSAWPIINAIEAAFRVRVLTWEDIEARSDLYQDIRNYLSDRPNGIPAVADDNYLDRSTTTILTG